MRQGTINNYIKFSKNFGGVRKCYEGKPTIAVGGFMCDPTLMPVAPNVMAAGTLVYADEQARTIVPIYTFKVKSVDASENKITIEKFETGTIAKVGMKLLVVGSDLTQAVSNLSTVIAIDSSNADYDVLTVDAVSTGGSTSYTEVTDTTGKNPATEGWYEDNAGATLTTDTTPDAEKTYYKKVVTSGTAFVAQGDVLAEAQSASVKKIKAIPNGLTYCDNVLDPDAYAIDIDYIWNCMEKPVLERRMPPLTDSLKKALRDNECYFRFSNRK